MDDVRGVATGDTGPGSASGVRWSDALAEVERQREELSRVADQLVTLSARAVSTDRLVAVTVNARGLLTALEIEPAALRRHRAAALSDLITSLVADADRQLQTRREQLLADVADPAPGYRDTGHRSVGGGTW